MNVRIATAVIAVFVAMLAAGTGAGCRTAAPAPAVAVRPPAARPAPPPLPPLPPIALKPAADSNRMLAFDVIAAPPAAIAGDLDALGRKLGIGTVIGESFLGGLTGTFGGVRVSRASLDRLDPVRPATAVFLFPTRTKCVAIPFKDGAGARQTLEEIGPEITRAGGESSRRTSQGTIVFAGLADRTLLLSDTAGEIAASGAVAIALADAAPPAARRGDVVLEAHPGAFGAFMRAAAEAALPGGLAEMEAEEVKKGKPTPKEMLAFISGLAKLAIKSSASAETVRLIVDAGVDAGFALRFEIDPVPATDFARRLAVAKPYGADPGLALADDRLLFGAWGSMDAGVASLVEVLAEGGPAGRDFRRALVEFAEVVDGAGSCSADFVDLPIHGLCAWPLRRSSDGAKAVKRYARLIETSTIWTAALLGQKVPKVKTRQAGGVIELQVPIVAAADEPAMTTQMRRLAWGGDELHTAVAIRDGRMVVAQGRSPRALLTTFGHPASGTGRAARLETAFARSRTADAIVYFDIVSLLVMVAKHANDPVTRQMSAMMSAIPGLATVRAPFVFLVRSGERLSFELALPPDSAASLADMVKPFMGVMGQPK